MPEFVAPRIRRIAGSLALILGLLAIAACAGATPSRGSAPAAPGPPTASNPATPEWQAQLDQIIAAARAEGALTINVQPGQAYRDWVEQFAKKYPFLRVEQSSLAGNDFVTRALSEQRTGLYLWDVHLGGPDSAFTGLVSADALDPIAPAVVLPEVLDDSQWLDGFDGGFADRAGKFVYTMQAEVVHPVAVNRDFVPESQLNRVEDVLDPQWNGKISIYDPRIAGSGSVTGGHLLMLQGPDWWRQLLQTSPVVTRDRRQQIEWLIRGQYPITVGFDNPTLGQFRKEGVANSIQYLAPDTPLGHRLLLSFSVLLPTSGPHPNAARLFLNWALSREGQDLMQRIGNTASRRLDVGEVPPLERANPSVPYPPPLNKEVNAHYNQEAVGIATETIRN